MWLALLRTALAMGLLVLSAAGLARAAATPGQKCAAAKRKLAGKKIAALTGCDAKAVAKGTPVDSACVSKATTAFMKGWGKAEGKGGCATTNDETTIENKVDAHQTDLESTLEVTGMTPSKCTAAKFKAAGKKDACKLGCSAKAARKGLPLSAPTVMACLSACSMKFSAAFTKAEAKGGCRTTGDAGTVEGKIDAFVADATDELPTSGGGTTTTTTSSTTTTTIANCALVAGNLVQNCGFETPAVSPGSFSNFGPGDTSITGWTVATTPPGGVDLTTSTFFGGFPVHGGMQSLDLNHDNPGGIFQDIATTAGQPYQLTFFLSGFPAGSAPCSASDPKTLTVTAGTASANYSFPPDTQASPPGNQQFAQETLAFTGAGGSSTTLTFTSTTAGCAGPLIDDVIVVPGP